jgi:transposase InsO family protein
MKVGEGTMGRHRTLTIAEREAIYQSKLSGTPLVEVAQALGCSLACVRKWWRVGRDKGLTGLHRQGRKRSAPGALSQFEPLVAERALYWKQQHPKRGASRILADLATDPDVAELCLPRPRTLARFFQQQCPHLLQKRQPQPSAPPSPRQVHELWQLDSKEAIRLGDGSLATVLEVREPVACACLGLLAHQVDTARGWRKLSLREIQADLRQVFSVWGLPAAIQTDRERVYGQPASEGFPSRFTLWLIGLGLRHEFSRPRQPTDQAAVEREHRTIFDWLERPQPWADLSAFQTDLDRARAAHNSLLPSQAGDCQNHPPLQAHPEVGQPLRPYHPSAELALFQLGRVDAFLARFHWTYQVSSSGQVLIAQQAYSVGVASAGQRVDVVFEPQARSFAFHDGKSGTFIKRHSAKGLDVATITGLQQVPPLDQHTQLSFPFFATPD